MAASILHPRHAAVIVALIAVLAILGYGILAGWQLVSVWIPSDGQGSGNPAVEYTSAALTGLVGGVVATAFGVKRPDPNVNALNSLSGFATAAKDSSTTKQWIGTLYVSVYLIIGLLTVFTWAFPGSDASEAVKITASTFIGMVTAIVASFFASDIE